MPNITINWKPGQMVILKGTPVDANGNIANDGTAVGIVSEDTKRPLQAPYINSGTWDEETNYGGFAISDDCKRALPEIIFTNADGIPTPATTLPKPVASDADKNAKANEHGTAYELGEGGGSGLPPVTGSGKALVSIDGEWVEQRGYPYEESGGFEPITWDGDTSGKESVADSFFKMSDNVPNSYSDIIGATIVVTEINGGSRVDAPTVISTENIIQLSEEIQTDTAYIIYANAAAAVIANESVEAEGLSFSKGVWFFKREADSFTDYTSSLTAPSTVHTIDPKYLPSDIPTTDDVQDMIDTTIGDAIGGAY